jgi:hypothetical protein
MSDVAGFSQPARRGARKKGGPVRGFGGGSSGQTTSLPISNVSNGLPLVTMAKQASTFGSARVFGETAGKDGGGDARCTDGGISAASAYVLVACAKLAQPPT